MVDKVGYWFPWVNSMIRSVCIFIFFFTFLAQAKTPLYRFEMKHWLEEMIVAGIISQEEIPQIKKELKGWNKIEWENFKKQKSQLFFHRPITYSKNKKIKNLSRGPASEVEIFQKGKIERKVQLIHQDHENFEELNQKVQNIYKH